MNLHSPTKPPRFYATAQLAIISVLLTVVPVALSLRVEGLKAIFGYFAADTFFYLAVAKNINWLPIFSFDGINPTNGFHPLWQIILKAANQIFGFNSLGMIDFAFAFSVVCVSIALTVLVLTTHRLIRRPILALFSVFPGFIYILCIVSNPLYGNPWNFINGMESPLSLLLFSVILYLAARFDLFLNNSQGKIQIIISISFLVAMLIMSRLDDIFLLVAFAASSLLIFTSRKDKIINTTLLCLIPFVVISGYMIFNLAYSGSALPISGIAKGGFSLFNNIDDGLNVVVPRLYLPANSWANWRELSYRSILMNLPALIAIYFIVVSSKYLNFSRHGIFTLKNSKFDGRISPNTIGILFALSLYIILKWLYNLTNVEIWHQGHWYFPLSIMSANLITAYIISINFPAPSTGKEMQLISMIALFSLNLYITNGIEANKADIKYNQHYHDLWSNRVNITNKLIKLDPNAKLVEFDDGIISYSLNVPAMSGLGFALDKDGLIAKKKGDLLKTAKERGFNYIASLNYLSSDISKSFFLGNEADQWIFKEFLADDKSGLKIYSFTQKSIQ